MLYYCSIDVLLFYLCYVVLLRYSFQNTLQLLGLDEAEDNNKDPVMMKGAYLSLLYLRHLRVKELQVKSFSMP